MSRELPEWRGQNDNTAIPTRVKDRISIRQEGKCAICSRKPLRPAFDHILALINGGKNCEPNLQMLCVSPCHRDKTKVDVAQKSKNYRVRAKHLGITTKRKKIQSRGFDKSAPQRTASRQIERRS